MLHTEIESFLRDRTDPRTLEHILHFKTDFVTVLPAGLRAPDSMSVLLLELSNRPQRVLDELGIKTVRALVRTDPQKLLEQEGFAWKSLADIYVKLAAFGRTFGDLPARKIASAPTDMTSVASVPILDGRQRQACMALGLMNIGRIRKLSPRELGKKPGISPRTARSLAAYLEQHGLPMKSD